MNPSVRKPAPERLPEKITNEALSILALGGARGIRNIAPLEATLPLIVKAWSLPEELLKEKADLLEQGKAQAASGEAVLPERDFLVSCEGVMIVELLWDLFETAVKLETQEERKVIYDSAVLSAKALDLQEWLFLSGKAGMRLIWDRLKSMLKLKSPAERKAAYDKALSLAERLNLSGGIMRCV